MNVPIEVAAPVATALLTAVGFLFRAHVKRSADCDARVTALEKRVDDLQEKRVAERASDGREVVEALRESAEAARGIAAEMKEHRDWSSKAIVNARDEIVMAIRAAAVAK